MFMHVNVYAHINVFVHVCFYADKSVCKYAFNRVCVLVYMSVCVCVVCYCDCCAFFSNTRYRQTSNSPPGSALQY